MELILGSIAIIIAMWLCFGIAGFMFNVVAWIFSPPPSGQMYMGSSYRRNDGEVYTHKRPRKRDASGHYKYFDR